MLKVECPKITGESQPSSMTYNSLKTLTNSILILLYRYGTIYRSKLKYSSFFSLLRGFTDENLHYVSLNLHTLYQRLEGFVCDPNSARFITDALMPEFFIFVCFSTFNISYSQVERYL